MWWLDDLLSKTFFWWNFDLGVTLCFDTVFCLCCSKQPCLKMQDDKSTVTHPLMVLLCCSQMWTFLVNLSGWKPVGLDLVICKSKAGFVSIILAWRLVCFLWVLVNQKSNKSQRRCDISILFFDDESWFSIGSKRISLFFGVAQRYIVSCFAGVSPQRRQ